MSLCETCYPWCSRLSLMGVATAMSTGGVRCIWAQASSVIAAALYQDKLPLQELVVMLDLLLTLPAQLEDSTEAALALSICRIHSKYWSHKSTGAQHRLHCGR